ncbi:VCBS domain-containing protein, partial [Colwellia echini]
MADSINKDKVNDNDQLNAKEVNPDLTVKQDDIINETSDVDDLETHEIDAEDLAEIEAIQAEIEAGEETVEVVETAAGESNDGGSTEFVTVSRDANETLVSSEFKTASFAFNSASIELTDTNDGINDNFTNTDTSLRAQFTDNFVSGVSYTTSSGLTGLTGDTGTAGEFKYNAGDIITFSIGDVIIAQFNANAINGDTLFLQDIAGTELSDSNSSHVENMAIFLQALDSDLTDSNNTDGILSTDQLINNENSYATNIIISQEIRDAFTGYIDPTTGEVLDITTSGKEMISQALASVGIEFTRESERNDNGENTFESIAMDHVAQTIDGLAGDRAPENADAREIDTIDVPGGLINYHFLEAEGVITFTTDDLLVGAVGKQVITENLIVDNVKLSASFENIGTLVDKGDGNFEIKLNESVTGKDLEGLAIDYRVEDWTVSKDVTSQSLDSYKSHLSADINDVKEDSGFNQFTLNSSLSFDTDTQLTINFTSELLSEQLTAQVQAELIALGKDAVIDNGIIQIAEYADDYNIPLEYSNDGGNTWISMTVVAIDTTGTIPRPIFGFELAAGNNSIEIRVPIFDDVTIEPTEYFRAEIKGENYYDETILFAIEDNDSLPLNLPQIDIDYVLITEGQGDAIFTLTLSEASDEVVTVNYNTTELTAKFGEDFANTSGTVTFQPGETTATISIAIADDLILENSPEFAVINLSDATNATINDAQGTLRIFDNDYPVELTVSSSEINEGETALFTVNINKDLGNTTDSLTLVNLSLKNGSANEQDYDVSSIKAYYGEAGSPQYLEFDGKGNVIVPVGITSITVIVDTIDDSTNEQNESFTLTAKIGDSQGVGTAIILGNDVDNNIAPKLSVEDGALDEDSGSITVSFTAEDIDGTIESITATVPAEQGNVVVNNNGTYTFTPADNFNGEATITLVATDNNGGSTIVESAVTVNSVNDAATITLLTTTDSFTEEGASINDEVATFSTFDEDGDEITVTLSDTTNYALVGNTVVLTQAGVDLIDRGEDLPGFTLSATDGEQEAPSIININPGNTIDVNDAATITLLTTTDSFTEEGASINDEVATFSTFDEDGDEITVTLSDTTNYALVGNTVVLTQAGVDLIDRGEDLPGFTLSATDGEQTTPATVNVSPGTTIDINDIETLTITNGTATEDTTVMGTILGSYTLTDEEGEAALTVDFTPGTNINNYYVLDGTDIKLTALGESYLDSGNNLPNISLTTSDGVVATNTVTTILVNDVEVLTITNGTATEDSTAAGSVLASYTLTDDEGGLTVDFTSGTNDQGYYVLDGTDVKLTPAGEVFLNAGNTLPNISLTTSDGVSASNTVTTVLVNDAAQITNNTIDSDVIEDDLSNTAIGTIEIIDEDTGEGTLASSTATYGTVAVDAAGQWTYSLDNNNAAVQALPAGQTLVDTITFTSDDGTTETQTITITGSNDAADITVTASDTLVTEDDASNNTATGTVSVSDIDTGEGTLVSSTASYGTVVVDGTGVWEYSLDDSNAAVQALPDGETLTDTITFTSDDGTTETQTITITGSNDAADITVTASDTSVTE